MQSGSTGKALQDGQTYRWSEHRREVVRTTRETPGPAGWRPVSRTRSPAW